MPNLVLGGCKQKGNHVVLRNGKSKFNTFQFNSKYHYNQQLEVVIFFILTLKGPKILFE
jgi:hypothetical protein